MSSVTVHREECYNSGTLWIHEIIIIIIIIKQNQKLYKQNTMQQKYNKEKITNAGYVNY